MTYCKIVDLIIKSLEKGWKKFKNFYFLDEIIENINYHFNIDDLFKIKSRI